MQIVVLGLRLSNINCDAFFDMLKLLLILGSLYLSGCVFSTAILPPTQRALQAAQLATKAGWKEHTIHTSLFTLKAYGSSTHRKIKTLTIYIEGDGLAWLSEDTPSHNPTPMVPTGLKMAIQDQKNKPTAYLARPCQFVFKEAWRQCRQDYWTNLRFSPDVIQAMDKAVQYLKRYYHAQHIVLIGYSGGGTIATLLAAKRHDVIQVITVAAILDIDYWAKQENLTPLYGSLNPADAWKKLLSIPQTHWIGGKDAVVSKEVAFSYVLRFPAAKKPKIKEIGAFNHTCCWARDWMSLLSYANLRP